MIPKTLEDRNAVLFDKLVPFEGQCDTLQGETLRAVNRIIYRYYNDGDYWYEGYGIETAGAAEAFLRQYSPVNVLSELRKSDGVREKEYETALEALLVKVLNYIETCSEFLPNTRDMHDCEPKYEPEYEEEDC
ncbi:hypothetical protein [Nitrospira sp. BLG_2]|uniref:hypothetical protein n=1 Tax=Nitrospira sp. BLG_2 TaxID=3397507 RepID=UPI003B9D434D